MKVRTLTWSDFAVLVVFCLAMLLYVRLVLLPKPPLIPDETFLTTPALPEYEPKNFSKTTLVPTLDSPIPKDQNCIWSASSQYAWNQLKAKVGGNVLVESSSAVVKKLNDFDFDPNSVSTSDLDVSVEQLGSFYSITAKIQLTVPFKFEFFDEGKPALFKETDQTETPIAMFGIREDEMYNTMDYRKQVDVLWDTVKHNGEFAVDLCRYTEPYQLILARMPRPKSLAEAIKYLHSRKLHRPDKLHDEDMLLVPRMAFRMQQSFSELDGQVLKNTKFVGLPIQTANEIQWTLDKTGAKALASSTVAVLNGGPRLLSFDRPFLILILNRKTNATVLAIWVENAELLTPFPNE